MTTWLRRRALLIDPGGFRLAAALRALAVAAVAVAVTASLCLALGWDVGAPASIGGMFTLFATAATAPRGRGIRRFSGLLALVPAVGMLAIGALLPTDDVTRIVSLAVVAFAAVWLGRFGAVIGALGQFGFVAFYYSALMAADLATLPRFIVAATVAVVVSAAGALIPEVDRRGHVLGPGVTAIIAHVDALLSPVHAAVSMGAAPRRTRRALAGEARGLRAASARLGGRLELAVAHPPHPRGLLPGEAATLRQRVFDVELAATHLASLAPLLADGDEADRARLAAELAAARAELTADLTAAPGTTPVLTRLAADDPDVRRGHDALRHVLRTVRALRAEDATDLRVADDERPVPVEAAPPSTLAAPTGRPLTTRRAVQAAVSTGLALWVGSLIMAAKPYWAAMPAFQVLQTSAGETRLNAIRRVVAAVLGSAVGFALAAIFSHALWADLALLAVAVFGMAFSRGVSTVLQAFWQTTLMALMYDALGALALDLLVVRVVETVAGAGVAVLVASVLLPVRTHAKVRAAMARVVRAAGDLVATSLPDAATPGAAVDAAAVRRAGATVQRTLGEVERLAGPVRLDPGTLGTRGIEQQLTILWSIARDARTLDLALHRDGHLDAVPPATWRRLRRVTAQNVDAAATALTSDTDTGGTSLEAVDALTGSDPADEALRRIRALNSHLVALTQLADGSLR